MNVSAPSAGDTFKVLENGAGEKYWGWESIKGINYKGEWDVVNNPALPPNPTNGDYYILSSSGDDSSGSPTTWITGDWAIYDETSGSYQKIPTPASFQKFNDRSGDIESQTGDYTFDMLDFNGSSISYIEDVDLTVPPTDGQVLKYQTVPGGLKKWVPGDDDGGLIGKITTNEITDNTVTSSAFENGTFEIIDFQNELQLKINEHYESGDLLKSNLNFGGNFLTNCTTINGINVIDLYNNCVLEDPSLYLPKLSDPSFPNNSADPNDRDNANYFLNERGQFVRININDLEAGTTNATFNPDDVRQLPLKESFHVNLPEDEPEELEPDDTLWEAIAKIWNRATQSLSLTPSGLEFVNNYNVDKDNDDQKTLFITSGNVVLPTDAFNGFLITIKSKSPNQVDISAGAGQFIDDFETKITLVNKHASVRLIKGKRTMVYYSQIWRD